MSNPEIDRDRESPGGEVPRLEPWLVVMLLAIVPMLVALALPREFVMHLATVSGILFAAGTAMLIVHDRRRR